MMTENALFRQNEGFNYPEVDVDPGCEDMYSDESDETSDEYGMSYDPDDLMFDYHHSYLDDCYGTNYSLLTPVGPPPPRQLVDSDAFAGNRAPVWVQEKYNHHVLVDRTTGRPAILALQMKIATHNFDIMNGMTMFISGTKINCVGTRVGLPHLDECWRKSMERLEHLMQTFTNKFPRAAASEENSMSFMQRRANGITTIKIQQPLREDDRWMYGLEYNPYYAHFLRVCPAEYKYIDTRLSPMYASSSRTPINPLPAYDTNGSIIPPKDYGTKFDNRELVVEAEFSLHHFVLLSGGRCFIAVPNSLTLVDPAELVPENTERANEGTLGIKQEVKDEPDVKQEAYEGVYGVGLKRKYEDDADEEFKDNVGHGVKEEEKDSRVFVKKQVHANLEYVKGEERDASLKIEGGSDGLEVAAKKKRRLNKAHTKIHN